MLFESLALKNIRPSVMVASGMLQRVLEFIETGDYQIPSDLRSEFYLVVDLLALYSAESVSEDLSTVTSSTLARVEDITQPSFEADEVDEDFYAFIIWRAIRVLNTLVQINDQQGQNLSITIARNLSMNDIVPVSELSALYREQQEIIDRAITDYSYLAEQFSSVLGHTDVQIFRIQNELLSPEALEQLLQKLGIKGIKQLKLRYQKMIEDRVDYVLFLIHELYEKGYRFSEAEKEEQQKKIVIKSLNCRSLIQYNRPGSMKKGVTDDLVGLQKSLRVNTWSTRGELKLVSDLIYELIEKIIENYIRICAYLEDKEA